MYSPSKPSKLTETLEMTRLLDYCNVFNSMFCLICADFVLIISFYQERLCLRSTKFSSLYQRSLYRGSLLIHFAVTFAGIQGSINHYTGNIVISRIVINIIGVPLFLLLLIFFSSKDKNLNSLIKFRSTTIYEETCLLIHDIRREQCHVVCQGANIWKKCQYKQSRSPLFTLDDRERKSFKIKDDNGCLTAMK